MTSVRWASGGSTAEVIGRSIVAGAFQPGSVLPAIDRLAEELSVSRPVIREAMKVLSGKGLVRSTPRRGTVVRPRNEWSRLDPDLLIWRVSDDPNAAFIRNLFEVRRIVEPESAALVAGRATEEVLQTIDAAFQAMAETDPSSMESIAADVAFHRAILEGTGNEFLAAFAPAIEASLEVTFRLQRDKGRRRREDFVPEHGAILSAIRSGDPEAARETFRALLGPAEADAMEGMRELGKDAADASGDG